MANFMGPMAPPQAAPQTPPQLEVRTSPNQRAQFKSFMQGMNRPAAQPTTAPIAPMLPAPTAMDQVDIFAPARMADGGMADPYAVQGKVGQSVGPRMAGGTTNLIDGSGSLAGSDSGMDAAGMGMAYPPLPVTGTPALISSLDAGLENILQRDFADMDRMSAMGNAIRGSAPMAKLRDVASGILGATQMQGPMGGTFGIRPVSRGDELGIMANFSVPFEDGGPVRMREGGRLAGGTTNLRDTSRPSGPREERDDSSYFGDIPSYAGTQPPVRDDDGGPDPVNEAVQSAIAAELLGMSQDAQRADIYPTELAPGLMGDPNLSGGRQQAPDLLAPMDSVSPFVQGMADDIMSLNRAGDFDFGPAIEPVAPAKQDALSNFLDLNPQPDAGGNLVNPLAAQARAPVVDPMVDPYRGMGEGDFNFGPAAPRTEDLVSNLLNRPVQYTTRGGNVIDRTVQQDLEARGIPSGFPGPLGKVADIFTTQRVGKYLDEIGGGAPGVIDSTTGQVVGYVGSGPIEGSQTFTGRAGYNPLTGAAQDVRFDPSVNAYIVTPGRENVGEDAQQRNRVLPQVIAPTTDTTDTAPPPVVTPSALPPAMPDPMNVVVPSARADVPVTVPNILPGQGVSPTQYLPQSFLDLLAGLNRPAPRAMQDGGAVLDQAASNFLDALKVA